MAQVMTFELRLGEKRLHETSSDKLAEPLTIGSAENAGWRTPPEDTHAAPLEATLALVKGKATLVAAAGRSFVRLGVPEKKRVLAVGDRISVGDCELTVDEVEQVVSASGGRHAFEGLNGEHKGDRIEFAKARLLIGSADDCDLRLPLDVVSPHHAEITVEEATGIAWLRDLSSRNGTSVNGARLGDKPRLLQDGDVVGFAIWDFRFLDRNVRHVRSNLGRQLVLVVVTVGVALGAYFLMMMRTKSLDDCLVAARDAVREERFDDARAILATARACKDADKRADNIATATRIVHGLAMVHDDWATFCRLIEEKKWDEANDFSPRVPTASANQWEWNLEKSAERLEEARLTKQHLDVLIAARRAAEDGDMTLEARHEMAARLRALGVGTPAWTNNAALPAFRMSLRQGLAEQLARIDYLIGGLDDLHAFMGRTLQKNRAEKGVILEHLKALYKTKTGLLRRMVGDIQECVEKLADAYAALYENNKALMRLEFGFLDRPVAIPSADECLVDPVLQQVQAVEVALYARQRRVGAGVREHLARLMAYENAAGENPILKRFGDEAFWRRLFACGYWNGPLAKKERAQPVDEFDAELGYDFFYAYMRGAPLVWPGDYYQDAACTTLSFKPAIVTFAAFGRDLRAADRYFSEPDVQFYLVDKLKARRERIVAERTAVREVLKLLDRLAQEGKGQRFGEMAFAARLMLTPHEEIGEKEMKSLRDQARARHSEVLRLVQDYDPTDVKAAQSVRERVQGAAIPGDTAAVKVRVDQ